MSPKTSAFLLFSLLVTGFGAFAQESVPSGDCPAVEQNSRYYVSCDVVNPTVVSQVKIYAAENPVPMACVKAGGKAEFSTVTAGSINDGVIAVRIGGGDTGILQRTGNDGWVFYYVSGGEPQQFTCAK
jgi:hypothetical protein